MQLVLSLKLKCGDKEYYSLPAILSNCYKMMIVLSVKIYSVHYDIGLALRRGWSNTYLLACISLCGKEGVLEQVESCGSLGRILRKHLSNQVFQWLGEVIRHDQILLPRIDLYLELALPIER